LNSEDGTDVGSLVDKRVFLLNEFIYDNEGTPREIAQVVDVTQIITKDYTYKIIHIGNFSGGRNRRGVLEVLPNANECNPSHSLL